MFSFLLPFWVVSPFLSFWGPFGPLGLFVFVVNGVGRDLEGNTYWEFNDLRHSQSAAMANARPGDGIRMRRIVKYPRGTHPGSVAVSPQWHQWLRHVRPDAPSLLEQQREVARQEQMRVLAARADARWAGAKRVDGPIEAEELGAAAAAASQEIGTAAPDATTTTTTTTTTLPAAEQTTTAEAQPEPVHVPAQAAQQQQAPPAPPADDPWKREELSHGALGESWQPKQWSPPAKKR